MNNNELAVTKCDVTESVLPLFDHQRIDVSTSPDRLTAVEMLYYRPDGKDPIAYTSKFTRSLKTIEQPCLRRQHTNALWTKVYTGWIVEAAMVWIMNHLPTYKTIPSSQEKQEAAGCIIQVGMRDSQLDVTIPFALVLPGESIRFSPVEVHDVYIRCISPVRRAAEYTSVVFSK